MDREDFPLISPASDSIKIDGLHAEEPKPAPKPAPAPAPQRNPTETRRATTVPVRPAAPPPPPAAGGRDEDDPEKLLREYADRQKNKIGRMEQDLQKMTGERDALKTKSETLAKELQDARSQLQMIPKLEETIKGLQEKVDAALLSNGMVQAENSKFKLKVGELEASLKKTEERATHAEKSLADTQTWLKQQTQGRLEAEQKIAIALQTLQGKPGAAPAPAPPKK